MNIQNSQNVVGGSIDANGNVIIGNGNVVINLKEAASYKQLQADLEEQKALFTKTQGYAAQYPNDKSFQTDLLSISTKENEIKARIAQLKKEVLALALDFSKVSVNSDRLRAAQEYFRSGELDKARAALDIESMDTELESLKDEQKYLEKRTAQNIQRLEDASKEFLILARLTMIDFSAQDRFEKAKRFFEQSLSANTNAANLLGYIEFLKENKQFATAYEQVPRLEELLQNNDDNAVWIQFLNLKASLEESQEKYKEATSSYVKAIELYKKALQPDHQESIQLLIEVQSSLALLLIKIKLFDDAYRFATDSINLYRRIRKPTPASKAVYARAARVGGVVCYEIKKSHDKDKRVNIPEENIEKLLVRGNALFQESLDIYRQLVDQNPGKYLADYVSCLTVEAKLVKETQELTEKSAMEIEKIYMNAIEIARKESTKNPGIYLPVLGECLFLFFSWASRVYYAVKQVTGQVEEGSVKQELEKQISAMAEQYKATGEEALQIAERLYADNPLTYQPVLTDRQYRMGSMYFAIGQKDLAVLYFERSYENYKILRERVPGLHWENSLRIIEDLATAYWDLKLYAKMETTFLEYIDSLAVLIANKEVGYFAPLINTYVDMAQIFSKEAPDKEKSLKYAKEALNNINILEESASLRENINVKHTKNLCNEIISSWHRRWWWPF